MSLIALQVFQVDEMSTVDLANDEGFGYSLDEEGHDLNAGGINGDRDEATDNDNSSSSGDAAQCMSQSIDYTQLQLAQRHRSRRPPASVDRAPATAPNPAGDPNLLASSPVRGLRGGSGVQRVQSMGEFM